MRPFPRNAGFTLMEVGLAITVGTVLVAAAVYAYQQAKESAGDAVGKQRLADLQVQVEGFYTQNNYFPSVSQLGDQWRTREDYLKSPWGGQIIAPSRPAGIDGSDCLGYPANCQGVSTPQDLPITAGPLIDGNVDSIQYYRLTQPGLQPPPCCSRLWDITKTQFIPIYGYGLGYNKHGRSFYFVSSGRSAQ